MKLEWFRKHKQFVYWILLPVVGIGMAFFGVSNLFKPGALSNSPGPTVRYTVAEKTYFMDPMQVFALRQILARFLNRNEVSSDYAARHEVKYHMALAGGFEFGAEELREKLVEQVKKQVKSIEREDEVRATEEVYDKLLAQRSLTRTQFEQMTRELSLNERLERICCVLATTDFNNLFNRLDVANITKLLDKVVNDPELFIAYLRDNEVVRLRYKEVASEDFLNKTQPSLPEKIKTFYDNHQDLKNLSGPLKDLLVAKPKMSAEILFYDPAPLFKDLKPTEDELKKFYEARKSLWKEAPKPGEPPPAPGVEPKEKDYNTVKEDVEKKWLEDQKRSRPQEKLKNLKDELAKAEKAWAEEEAKKPEVDRKPFDLAAWAEKNGLKYWLTGELTQEAFKKGKKEVGARDAEWVERLFELTKPFNQFFSRDPAQQKKIEEMVNENRKKQLKEFGYPEAVEPNAPEKGFVLVRKKTFVDENLKTYADVQTGLGEYLRIQDAAELAGKEAKRLHDEWVKGGNLPDMNSLEEISDNNKNKSDNPLIEKFFEAPKAVGEILEVASGPAKPDKPDEEASAHQRFYIGFAVERQLPTRTTFHKDITWNRDEERRKLALADIRAVYIAFEEQALHAASVPRGITDPPLFEGYRHSAPAGDDDGL